MVLEKISTGDMGNDFHWGSVRVLPGMSLNDLIDEAKKNGYDYLKELKVGQIIVSDIPNDRIRVTFDAGGIAPPRMFEDWANELIDEMERVSFSALSEIEEKSSDVTLVEVRPFGASGRLYLGGTEANIEAASNGVIRALESLEGREMT